MSEITHNSTRDTAMPKKAKRRASPLLDAGPWLVFAAFAIVPLLASVLGDSFLLVIVTRIMIFALAALSLNFIMGYGALVSFGHAAYIGIGAYAVGILSSYGIDDLILQLVAAEGIELEERAFSVEEAKRAREIFVTAASSFVMPITSLDGTRIGEGKPGPVATRLREIYLEQARREAI